MTDEPLYFQPSQSQINASLERRIIAAIASAHTPKSIQEKFILHVCMYVLQEENSGHRERLPIEAAKGRDQISKDN